MASGRKFAPVPDLDELLKNNSELKKADIEHIQEWMSKQPHLPEIPDAHLVPLLHACHYSLERTKHTTENYFTIRTHIPELFSKRGPSTPELRKQLTYCQAAHLIEKDNEGNRVWIIRLKPGENSASHIDFDMLIKWGLMILDQVIREDPTCAGHILVADAKGLSMAHVAAVKISTIRRLLKYVQEGFNIRLKSVHVINVSHVVDYFFQLIKPFLDKELMDKIFLYSGSVNEVYKCIPQRIMPKDYGGEDEDMETLHDFCIRVVENNSEWYKKSDYFVDEKKRPGKSKKAEDIFGLEGSFKKLDVE